MEKVTFELGLGFGVNKKGRGPFFIQRAQMERCKVRKCRRGEKKQSTQSGQDSRGREGTREAQVRYHPDPGMAPLRGRAAQQVSRSGESILSGSSPMEMQPKRRAGHVEEDFLVLSPLQVFQLI